MDKELLIQFEQVLGYKVTDTRLLSQALTHSSGVDNRLESNERLEFLGDAVLSIIICQTLYQRFPEYLEGELTKIKSLLVSRRSCAKIAKRLTLQQYLKVGKGMQDSRALSGSIAAGLLEALIAVIYLDGGFDAARSFVLTAFGPMLQEIENTQNRDNFKSLLQQYAQQKFNAVPVYLLLDEKGPDHNKCFETQVLIKQRYFQSAWGRNKKQAEQQAALNALLELGVLKKHLLDKEKLLS